ncbi:MAG: hypothetical protein PHO32_09785, partial [Candidatus Cloacimonetes bacterium]|nr:hypothetical protein [Candidatus Cloacimonadota bacterium]
MNYSLLSEWVKENSDFSGSVESCYLLPEIVIFTLKGGEKLCFVLSNRDSFIYFDNSRLDLSEAKSIWQNLKNSRIDNLRIAEQDRIIYFNLSHQDIYQQNHTYILVAELMMPQPNLIFCNSKMQ